MIEGMFGIHNGSWMTSSRDLADAVKDYDYDLGRVIEERLNWANSRIDEYEELEKENWELTEKVEEFEEENRMLENDYDNLQFEYDDLKAKYEELEKEDEELKKENEELKLQLNQIGGFHFLFESEEG